jgi:hypothetical protein
MRSTVTAFAALAYTARVRGATIEQDARGVISAWNDDAAPLHGWTPEDAISTWSRGHSVTVVDDGREAVEQ